MANPSNQQKLEQLKAELRELPVTITPHPIRIRLTEQISSLERLIASEGSEVKGEEHTASVLEKLRNRRVAMWGKRAPRGKASADAPPPGDSPAKGTLARPSVSSAAAAARPAPGASPADSQLMRKAPKAPRRSVFAPKQPLSRPRPPLPTDSQVMRPVGRTPKVEEEKTPDTQRHPGPPAPPASPGPHGSLDAARTGDLGAESAAGATGTMPPGASDHPGDDSPTRPDAARTAPTPQSGEDSQE